MTNPKELETPEQAERRRKQNLEDLLYEKFKHLKKDDFLLKASKSWEDDELVDYETMIEHLTEVVDQHLFDEELALVDLHKIDEKQWDEWIAEYDVPEECCDRCGGRGCNYCLMCSY